MAAVGVDFERVVRAMCCRSPQSTFRLRKQMFLAPTRMRLHPQLGDFEPTRFIRDSIQDREDPLRPGFTG